MQMAGGSVAVSHIAHIAGALMGVFIVVFLSGRGDQDYNKKEDIHWFRLEILFLIYNWKQE